MTDKTLDQLSSLTTVVDADLLAIYPAGGPLKKVTFAIFKGLVATALGSTYLTVSNNLSDLPSASIGRANLGLGSASVLAAASIFQVANNFSEVANAATARTNIGAIGANAPSFTGGLTASGGATITGGASVAGGLTVTGGQTLDGSVKSNVTALGALAIDVSLGEFFTKSISTNSTFTFTNATATKAQAFLLDLTISSSAVPTWPAAVKWPGGTALNPGNGRHLLGFVTDDGGTTWVGLVGASNVS